MYSSKEWKRARSPESASDADYSI